MDTADPTFIFGRHHKPETSVCTILRSMEIEMPLKKIIAGSGGNKGKKRSEKTSSSREFNEAKTRSTASRSIADSTDRPDFSQVSSRSSRTVRRKQPDLEARFDQINFSDHDSDGTRATIVPKEYKYRDTNTSENPPSSRNSHISRSSVISDSGTKYSKRQMQLVVRQNKASSQDTGYESDDDLFPSDSVSQASSAIRSDGLKQAMHEQEWPVGQDSNQKQPASVYKRSVESLDSSRHRHYTRSASSLTSSKNMTGYDAVTQAYHRNLASRYDLDTAANELKLAILRRKTKELEASDSDDE